MTKNTNTRNDVRRRRARRRAGFTMAELLIVVAIIAALSGVGFVAVQSYQKSMNQLELDTIAKQIYVAAQNHLLMAETQNYLGTTESGYGQKLEGSDSIYYLAANKGTVAPAANTMFDQILPFGSIDENVRAGGSYIIYYQPGAAKILDVFYADESYDMYGNAGDLRKDYSGDNKTDRKDHDPMLGWYGSKAEEAGDGVVEIANGDRLEQPTILIENKEKLRVTVTDPNYDTTKYPHSGYESGYSLVLIVSGLDYNGAETDAKKAIKLYPEDGTDSDLFESEPADGVCVYKVLLDDITKAGKHFANLTTNTSESFVPGQNITIQAVAYNTVKITNIAYSDVETTNSLFEDIGTTVEGETKVITAKINNIRHLENLEEDISGLDVSKHIAMGNDISLEADLSDPSEPVGVGMANNTIKALQTSDINWKLFAGEVADISIYPTNGEALTTGNHYYPVSPGYTLVYDGQHYNVYNINVSYGGDSGMFGALTGGGISNLALINFEIEATGTGNAGALAGKLAPADNAFNVSNVLVYNTKDFETELKNRATMTTVTAASGNAGGLVGLAAGEHCRIEKCAAAVVVKATGGDAGGLVGASEGGTVAGCYSGGHTVDSALNGSDAVIYDAANFNVTSGADKAAGGLIGSAGTTTIQSSYSTCSATGGTVGGLIGSGRGEIKHSYCTGLVKSTAGRPVEGAFAGEWTFEGKADADGNKYFEIINERDGTGAAAGGYTYLYPVSGSQTVKGVAAFDATAATFNEFSPGTGSAVPYSDTLKKYYATGGQVKYLFKTVEGLGASIVKNTGAEGDTSVTDFVATHYGDWPAPEIFVVNTKKTT